NLEGVTVDLALSWRYNIIFLVYLSIESRTVPNPWRMGGSQGLALVPVGRGAQEAGNLGCPMT
ncbi:MAG: hypothetical protein M0Z27_13395, partial [Thermaerobacter sp.]|nr:hypothetical protein [Thermaerobacter sp.]